MTRNPPHLSTKIYVARSPIHGSGLFAKRKIKAGELIGRIEDAKPTTRNGPHVLWVSESEGYRVGGPLKYINHSNAPNAIYYNDLTVVALRDISKDEEITHYYGEEWE